MKKILVLFMLLMTITANCFASSINQEFENTNIEQVKQGIVKAISIFSAKTNLVEKDDNGNFSRYVYLIDSKDYDNQHILKYSKFKGEESYDSVITDGTQDELIRINDKFIEMGLRV